MSQNEKNPKNTLTSNSVTRSEHLLTDNLYTALWPNDFFMGRWVILYKHSSNSLAIALGKTKLLWIKRIYIDPSLTPLLFH